MDVILPYIQGSIQELDWSFVAFVVGLWGHPVTVVHVGLKQSLW